MPTYNYAQYLPEAIESVLAQSYSDFEFIIIDDCSSDNTAEIVEKYASIDKRITFRSNEQNIGMVPNWNLCLQNSRGAYVKFLFGDDKLATRESLAKMVFVLDADPSVALVASSRNVIDSRSVLLSVKSECSVAGKSKGMNIIQDCLLEQRNKIGEPTVVLFRKNMALRGFNTTYRQLVDLEMWFALLEQGDFYFINEPLCSFRVHAAQQTQVNLSQGILPDEAFSLLQNYAGKSYITLSRIKRAYMMYVPIYAIWKQYRKGVISFQTLLVKINLHYALAKFIFFFPFFKAYKFARNIKRSL
jgi:glycosyltransferase involved in cell wall biosynthesis